jgi:hypothetical protein
MSIQKNTLWETLWCCLIWFLKPGLLFIWAIWDGMEFHTIRALYNTVRLSWICTVPGDCEMTPGGMSGGVCKSELCVTWLSKQFGIFIFVYYLLHLLWQCKHMFAMSIKPLILKLNWEREREIESTAWYHPLSVEAGASVAGSLSAGGLGQASSMATEKCSVYCVVVRGSSLSLSLKCPGEGEHERIVGRRG